MNASTAVFPGLKRVALVGATALLWLPGVGQAEETTIRFQLDWRFEGPSAPFLLAESRGYFAEEGLDVQIDSGSGSAGAINRVASGAYEMGFGDLNALVEFLAENRGRAASTGCAAYRRATQGGPAALTAVLFCLAKNRHHPGICGHGGVGNRGV